MPRLADVAVLRVKSLTAEVAKEPTKNAEKITCTTPTNRNGIFRLCANLYGLSE